MNKGESGYEYEYGYGYGYDDIIFSDIMVDIQPIE